MQEFKDKGDLKALVEHRERLVLKDLEGYKDLTEYKEVRDHKALEAIKEQRADKGPGVCRDHVALVHRAVRDHRALVDFRGKRERAAFKGLLDLKARLVLKDRAAS